MRRDGAKNMKRKIGLLGVIATMILAFQPSPATLTGTQGIMQGGYGYFLPCETYGHHVVIHLIGSISAGGKAFIGQTRSDMYLAGCPSASASAQGIDIRGFNWGGGSIHGTCSGTIGFGPAFVGNLIGPFSGHLACAVKIVTRLGQVASGNVPIKIDGFWTPEIPCRRCQTERHGRIWGTFERG